MKDLATKKRLGIKTNIFAFYTSWSGFKALGPPYEDKSVPYPDFSDGRETGWGVCVCWGGGYHWHTPTLRLGSSLWRQVSAVSRFFWWARDGVGCMCVLGGGYHWHTPTLRLGSSLWRQVSAVSRFFWWARDGVGCMCVCVGGGGGYHRHTPTLRLGSSLWRQLSAVSRFFWWASDGGL